MNFREFYGNKDLAEHMSLHLAAASEATVAIFLIKVRTLH